MAAKAPPRSRTSIKGSPTSSARVDRSPPTLALRSNSKSPGPAERATPLVRSSSGSNLRGRSVSPASKTEASTPIASTPNSRSARPPPPPRSSISGTSTPNPRGSLTGMSSPGPPNTPSTPAGKGKVPPPPRQSVTKLPQQAQAQAQTAAEIGAQAETIAQLTAENLRLATENAQLKADYVSLKEKYDRLKTQVPSPEPSAEILGAFFTELPATTTRPERRPSAPPDESISELLSLFAPK